MTDFEMEKPSRSSGRSRGREVGLGAQGEDNTQPDRNPASSQGTAHSPKPMVVVVDSGSLSFRRIEYELRKRYDEDYQVVSIPSSKWGIKRLTEFKAAGQEVALVLADQWMPDMSGPSSWPKLASSSRPPSGRCSETGVTGRPRSRFSG